MSVDRRARSWREQHYLRKWVEEIEALGFVFLRLILFPAWLYRFISDMRNHPEQTWDLMNGFERYGYILSKHRRRTPAPPPALRTRLSEHICVSQPVAQPTSCCSRCR